MKYRAEKMSCGMLAISVLGIRPPGQLRVLIIVFVFMDARPDVHRPDWSSRRVTPWIKRAMQRIRADV
jgi:hypothetical protein